MPADISIADKYVQRYIQFIYIISYYSKAASHQKHEKRLKRQLYKFYKVLIQFAQKPAENRHEIWALCNL